MSHSHMYSSAATSPALHAKSEPQTPNHQPHAMQLADDKDPSREQDRLLPIANISRLMKKVLPPHAKMSKESKSALQECVSEFIGFITSEASDRLVEEKRKTITGDDIIDSMRALGFDSYIEFLQAYLKKYRHSIKASKGGADKTAAAGAHKRGRKARGADDDDEGDHSVSPVPQQGLPGGVPPEYAYQHQHAHPHAPPQQLYGAGPGAYGAGPVGGAYTHQQMMQQQSYMAAAAAAQEEEKGNKRRRQ